MSDKQNDVPANLSITNNNAADNKTGKDNTPKIAVTKKAQIVNGILVMLIPCVRKLITVTMQFNEPINEDAIKMVIENNHNVIPNPDPDTACGNAESGGQIVQPAIAGPDSTNRDTNINNEERKKNQYDNMFKNPDAISLAPNCNGISKFEKVPDNPPVNKKNTMIVP